MARHAGGRGIEQEGGAVARDVVINVGVAEVEERQCYLLAIRTWASNKVSTAEPMLGA